jgi:hypothetical protein
MHNVALNSNNLSNYYQTQRAFEYMITFNTSSEFDNDFLQVEIYNEYRRNNSKIEWWHHIFGLSGTLISIFGILGKFF